MNLSLTSSRRCSSHLKALGGAALGMLAAVQITAAEESSLAQKGHRELTPLQRSALSAARREARASYARDTNAPFASVNLITNIISNPTLPPRVKAALSNPEVVAEIQACAHDNTRLAKHLEKPTNAQSVRVVEFLQHALNKWQQSWANFRYNQAQSGIREEASEIERFSNPKDPWPEGVAHARSNQAIYAQLSNRVIASIAPGGERAALNIDGDAGEKTLLSLQYVLGDLSRATTPLGMPFAKPLTPAELKACTLGNVRVNIIVALCNNLAESDPRLAAAIAPYSLEARVSSASAAALRDSTSTLAITPR